MSKSWKYVVTAYIVFFVMVLGICGSASMIFHAPPIVMRVLSNVCAWSPTLVLFLGWKKWGRKEKRTEFFKNCFAGKPKVGLLLLSILSTLVVFLLGAGIYAAMSGVPLGSLFGTNGFPILVSVLLSVLSGPTGEECGWRGYLRPCFEQKYGFLKGNLITGLVWTFWHTVLWFVDSDFTSGWDMVLYVLANVIVITSIHMIMAVVLEKQDNLLYAVLIHLFFNLPFSFLHAGIGFFVIISVLYVIEASAFLWVRKAGKSRG